jgi:hypothetical protein
MAQISVAPGAHAGPRPLPTAATDPLIRHEGRPAGRSLSSPQSPNGNGADIPQVNRLSTGARPVP